MGGAAKVSTPTQGPPLYTTPAEPVIPPPHQVAHQNDEGDLVPSGHHIVSGLYFLVGDYQTVDHQQYQIKPNCNDIAH